MKDSFRPVFLHTCKWHGVNLIYAMFWEHATWWPSLPKKVIYHCLINIFSTEQNVYPIFQSVYVSADALSTCGMLRCFQNKPRSLTERMPSLLDWLEDEAGQTFWMLLYHAEYLWNLPKNFYEIMAQGDRQYISTVKVLLKHKGNL